MKKTALFIILLICVNPVWAGWTVFNVDGGYLPTNNISVINADDSGYVWFSGIEGGVIKTDGDLLWDQYLAAASGLIEQ